MLIRRTLIALALVPFGALVALAQPNSAKDEKPTLISRLDSDTLPEGARLRLGRLSGRRYNGPFNMATISLDARLIAIASMNTGGVDILELATGRYLQRLKAPLGGSISSMVFSPDSKLIAVENFGQDLRVWDVASGKLVQQLQHRKNGGGNRGGPGFSADGKILCAGAERFVNKNNQGEIKAWDLATGKLIGPFETLHNYNIRGAVAPDGKSVISWGHYSSRGPGNANDREIPRTIQVWDLATAKEARQIKIDLGPQGFGNIVDAAFAPDGKTLAVTTGNSTFHLIDYATGKETRRFFGQRGGNMLRFSPDGAILAAMDSYGGAAHAWDFKTGRRIEMADGPKTGLLGLGFPGNGRVVALGNLSQALIWWDATADENKSRFDGHLTTILALAYTSDGKQIITAGSDHRLMWWHAQTGERLRELRLADDDPRYGYNGVATTLALAPNGQYAATTSNVGNGGVRLWKLKTGKAICDFEAPRNYSYPGIAFSPDSSRVAGSGSQIPLHIWNLQTGQELPKLPGLVQGNIDSNGPTRIAFSPDGRLVAAHLCYYDRFSGQPISDLIVWDLLKSQELSRRKTPMVNFGGVGSAGQLAFSVESKFLAVADGAGSIVLCEAETGREWRRLNSKLRNCAFHLAFSADGRFLAAGAQPFGGGGGAMNAAEPVIEMWELAGGVHRDTFRGHTAGITGLAFSPDATTLASISLDTTTLLWDLTGRSGPKVAPIAADDLPVAWKSLTGADPALSLAMKRMVQAPDVTVAFLKSHFTPVKGETIDPKVIAAIVNDLDNGSFKTREKASRELIRLGERAETALRDGLRRDLSVEARRRIQDILATIVRHEYAPNELQAIRGVEVLERIGTAEAREWLAVLAQGDPIATATRQAQAALRRIGMARAK